MESFRFFNFIQNVEKPFLKHCYLKYKQQMMFFFISSLKMLSKRSKSFNRDFNRKNKAWLFNTQITKKCHLALTSSSKVIMKRRIQFNLLLTAISVHFNQWRVNMDSWCNWLDYILDVFHTMDSVLKITEAVRYLSNSFTSPDIINDTVYSSTFLYCKLY